MSSHFSTLATCVDVQVCITTCWDRLCCRVVLSIHLCHLCCLAAVTFCTLHSTPEQSRAVQRLAQPPRRHTRKIIERDGGGGDTTSSSADTCDCCRVRGALQYPCSMYPVLQTVARLITTHCRRHRLLLYLLMTFISEKQREEKPRKYFNEYNI